LIRNETEYQEASTRLADDRKRLVEHRARLKEAGLGDAEIKRVIDPMESIHLQLQEEVESYERLKRGEFEELENLRGFRPPPDLSAHRSGRLATRVGQTAERARIAGFPR
jgi:hypothetical protein